MKWEYCRLDNVSIAEFDRELANAGQEGWQLIHYEGRSANHLGYEAILMRQVGPSEDDLAELKALVDNLRFKMEKDPL